MDYVSYTNSNLVRIISLNPNQDLIDHSLRMYRKFHGLVVTLTVEIRGEGPSDENLREIMEGVYQWVKDYSRINVLGLETDEIVDMNADYGGCVVNITLNKVISREWKERVYQIIKQSGAPLILVVRDCQLNSQFSGIINCSP